jgi:hypothetical protein
MKSKFLKWAMMFLVAARMSFAVFAVEQTNKSAREFYVDSRAGSDESSGSKGQPWGSLDRLGKVVFKP